MGRLLKAPLWVFLVPLLSSCLSYYQRNLEFNQAYETGDLDKAKHLLQKNSKAENGRERFLHFVNMGTITSLLGDYEESNEWFEKAYIFHEDERKNAGDILKTYLVNSSTTLYIGEDQEHLYVLYFKALNFMKLGRYEEAMVEVRRMEILLNQLDDKYSNEQKFNRDAFVNLLMGLIYDAQGDINNAFIAYRNAAKVYEEDYSKFFKMGTPVQLKKDLLRTARQMGFDQERERFEKKYNMKAPPALPKDSSQVVLFWHNGLGPVKDSWEISFIVVPQSGKRNLVYFKNDEFDLLFPFYVNSDEYNSLTDLRTFKIAFPKYVERRKVFQHAELSSGQNKVNLEKAENINAVSFKVLNQRMLLEMGQAILRVALKKAAEKALRDNDNQGAALAMAIYSYASEQADTRNWQTLPHSIEYARITVPEGPQELKLEVFKSKNGEKKDYQINVDVKAGNTGFFTFHTLDYISSLSTAQKYYD